MPARDDEEQPETAYALKALSLDNCPFYTRGDTLQVRLPGVYSHRTHGCIMPVTSFLPLGLEGAGDEGRFESGFKHCSCRWAYCRTRDLNRPANELEDMLTSEGQLAVSFLEQLPAPIARGVRERSSVLRYRKGEMILEDQVAGEYFFVILSGAVRVTAQGADGRVLELSTLRKGDCFGEMSLLTGAATSNRVEATEKCLLLAVARPEFHRLLSEFPLLSIILYRMLSKRIRVSNVRLTRLLAPGISGNLALFGIADIFQSILSSRLTGSLYVQEGLRQANFGFREGRLIYALLDDQEGAEALYAAFHWKDGVFYFNVNEPPPTENVADDTMGLLLEALRRLDESVATIENRATATEVLTRESD